MKCEGRHCRTDFSDEEHQFSSTEASYSVQLVDERWLSHKMEVGRDR